MMDFNKVKSMIEERKLNYFYTSNMIEGETEMFVPCNDNHYCCHMSFTRVMGKEPAMMLCKMGYEEVDYEAEFEKCVQLMLDGHNNIMSGHVVRCYGGDLLSIDKCHLYGEYYD